MASRRKMLIEMIDYRRFIGGDRFPSLSAVGSWEEVLLFSMDSTGCTFLFEKASLSFPN
jgi:hypothetical protein